MRAAKVFDVSSCIIIIFIVDDVAPFPFNLAVTFDDNGFQSFVDDSLRIRVRILLWKNIAINMCQWSLKLRLHMFND